MWTIEEFKRDTEKQILVACIVFFLVAFPYYFNAVSNGALGTSSGVTGLYEVGGDTRLVELDSGMEYVASGETWTIDDLSTDSVDGASDMNIVGVLVTLSYGEDETTLVGLNVQVRWVANLLLIQLVVLLSTARTMRLLVAIMLILQPHIHLNLFGIMIQWLVK